MYCPIGISSQVVVSGNEGCGYGYGCPYMLQQQMGSSEVVVPDKKEMEEMVEKNVEEIAKKTHEERLHTLVKQNKILAYELEQAKLKYSIQKLVSETQKLSTNTVPVSEVATETEDNVEVDV